MKFYLCDLGTHHKNMEAMRNMLRENNVEYTSHSNINSLDDTYDVAICTSVWDKPDKFPIGCKVIYGPGFFVFPNNMSHPINVYKYDPERFFFNALNEWVKNIYVRVSPNISLRFIECQLGIDIGNIQEAPPVSERKKIMIYFKHRHPSDLSTVKDFLDSKGQEYNVISYGSYKDADFKNKLKETRFVIWIGSHESQGFAFQETQASNVPILVWNVTSMRDEFNGHWPYGQPSGTADDLAATTANCWSDDCGIKFFRKEELAEAYDRMNNQVASFTPRKYIAERLSLKAAFENLITTIGLSR